MLQSIVLELINKLNFAVYLGGSMFFFLLLFFTALLSNGVFALTVS